MYKKVISHIPLEQLYHFPLHICFANKSPRQFCSVKGVANYIGFRPVFTGPFVWLPHEGFRFATIYIPRQRAMCNKCAAGPKGELCQFAKRRLMVSESNVCRYIV